MSNKDWMDYTNLAANIHQSIKLGEISNQLSQLTSINTAMLGNMNNLANIEVYKLEQEDNEKQFKQLLFNLKKFVKTKYEDPLTVALLKNGHCKMIDSLLDNFQRELKSFEDKEYVENIMDSFSEYSSTDVDFEALAKENEDGVTLLLSYMMFTDQISAKEKKLSLATNEIEEIKAKHFTPMQHWTPESLQEWFDKINFKSISAFGVEGSRFDLFSDENKLAKKMLIDNISDGEYQFFFKEVNGNINFDFHFAKKDENNGSKMGLFRNSGEKLKDKAARIQKEVLEKYGIDDTKTKELSSEITNSLSSLSDYLNKSNAEWINVEKKLLKVIYDTTLPIQGPYQYRKQVIGE